MRILHCISRLRSGGAERQLCYIACEQARQGHEVHVVYTHRGEPPREYRLAGVSLWQLRESSSYDPRLLLQMIRLLRKVRPDIVHTWIIQMDVVAGISCALAGVPWILREPSSEKAWPPTLKNRLRTCVGRSAKLVVSNSKAGAEYWAQHVSALKCLIVPNALPSREIEAAPNQLVPHPRVPTVLYVGRLIQREKNFLGTLTALVELVLRRDVQVHILGDGPDRSEASAMIRSHGVEHRVMIHGHVHDVWSWMKSAAVLVNASFLEGQPNAVLEAVCCGIPVVLSDIPAHRELLAEDQAWFVSAESTGDIRSGIERVLDCPETATAKAANARRRVEDLSIERAASEYVTIYSRVMGVT